MVFQHRSSSCDDGYQFSDGQGALHGVGALVGCWLIQAIQLSQQPTAGVTRC